MNTAKIYHDSEGNECSIWEAVRREPEWAASRIQVGEEAIEKLKELKDAWFQLVGNTTEPDVFGSVRMMDVDFEALDKLIKEL